MAKQFKLPISLVLLNGLGAILVGLGLVDLLGGIVMVPEALRIANYQVVMIAIGILLELTFIIYRIKQAKGSKPKEI